MPMLPVRDGTLHYTDDGDGPAVVLIHSLGLSSRMWSSTVRQLETAYRVLCVDCRGHGASETRAGFSFDLVVEDVLALLDHLAIASAHAAGISMGGKMAVLLHDRAPQRVRSLIIADSFGGSDPNGPLVRMAEDALAEMSMREFAVTYLRSRLLPHTPKAVHEEFAAEIAKVSKAHYLQAVREVAGRDVSALLSAIRVPTLILVGEKDQSTPPAEARKLRDAIAGAQMELIADAGHLSNLENPQRFDGLLRDFLDGLSR